MDDLEPFLSEINNPEIPVSCRLGSLHYLQLREDFMTTAERDACSQSAYAETTHGGVGT